CMTTARGIGTSVEVFIPLARIEAAAEQTIAAPGRVLVADDDPQVRDLIAAILDRAALGYQLFSSGLDAAKALETDPAVWALVLTDQRMPGLTGIQLIARAKALRPEIPCLLFSGSSDVLSETIAKAGGADRFLRKPIMPDEIDSAVRTLLAG